MARAPQIRQSRTESIDRSIEDAVGRIMNGKPQPNDYGVIADMSARRVQLAEPEAFTRLERLLEEGAALAPKRRTRTSGEDVGSRAPTLSLRDLGRMLKFHA